MIPIRLLCILSISIGFILDINRTVMNQIPKTLQMLSIMTINRPLRTLLMHRLFNPFINRMHGYQ